MKEKLKSSSKTLYVVCTCIIVLMVVCYLGNNNVKGTYSADSLTCSSGYKILTSGGKSFCCPNSYSQVIKKLSWSNYYCVNDSNVVRTDINGSETCAVLQSCVAGSSACENLSKSTTTAKLYSCSGSECTYYVKTSCVVAQTPSSSGSDSSDTTEAGCYLGAHMYQWFTTKPSGSAWTKVNITQANCKGCESGYTLNDDGDCVKSNPPTTEAGCYTAYYMYQWFDTKPSGSAWEKVAVTKDRCTGCVPGYTLNDDEECVIASANSKCWLCLGTSGSVSSGGYYRWAAASPDSNCHTTTATTAAACSGTPSPKKYKCTLTDNSEVCVTAYDSAWAGASVSETGTSCREVPSCGGGTTPTNPDKPDNPSKFYTKFNSIKYTK